jgi:ribosomal protein L30/L7E
MALAFIVLNLKSLPMYSSLNTEDYRTRRMRAVDDNPNRYPIVSQIANYVKARDLNPYLYKVWSLTIRGLIQAVKANSIL